MEFRVLGPLEVRAGDESLPLGSPAERHLLAVLLVYANKTVSTDRLVDELWADDPPPTARNIVQHYVSRLRRTLGDSSGEILFRGEPAFWAAQPARSLVLQSYRHSHKCAVV